MAPEEQAGSLEDTPQPDSPEGGTPETQDTDWEKRYKDLQSEYTQTSQQAGELQQVVDAFQSDDPQARNAAAEYLGISLVDEQGAPQEAPDEALARRLEAVESFLASGQEERAAEEMQAHDVDQINEALSGFETRTGSELTDEEVQLLASHAILNRTEDGVPGIGEALQLYENAETARQTRAQSDWAKSKRVSTPAVGQEGDETPSPDESHPDRVARMVERLQANP